MAVSFPLAADLPIHWEIGQIVSPGGTETGLTKQHGYNYLNQAVNQSQEAANALNGQIGSHIACPVHLFPVTAALTEAGVLSLTGENLPEEKDGLTVQFVSPAASAEGLQMQFAGEDTQYPILTTGEDKAPIQAGAFGEGVPVTLTISGGKAFFKGGGSGFPPGWNEKSQGIAWDPITKNSPIVQREYGKMEDGLKKLPDPDVLPSSRCLSCAYSPNGKILAVTCYESPYLVLYKNENGVFTKLPNPEVLPQMGENDQGLAFSPEGDLLAVAGGMSGGCTMYRIEGDNFTKLPNLPNPTTAGADCCFSPDGKYFVVVGISPTKHFAIYKRDGENFSIVKAPSELPTGNGYSCKFSPNGEYLAITTDTNTYIAIYRRSGDVFTKLQNPSDLPTGTGRDCCFSPDGNYLAVACGPSVNRIIYKRQGDTFSKIYSLSSGETAGVLGCSYDIFGRYLIFTGTPSNHPSLVVIKQLGDSFEVIEQKSELPNGIARRNTFSSDNRYLSVAVNEFPYIVTYLNEQKTYIHTLNEINKEYFEYAPKGKIGIANERKDAGETVRVTLFPALYSVTNEGNGGAKE